MKISVSWTPPGLAQSTSLVLVDSPAPIQYTNFRVSGSRNIQEAQFFRGVAAEFYDRGNRKTAISWDSSRLQATQSAAEDFILMHETQMPSGLVLVTIVTGPGAGASTTRYLVGAAINQVDSSLSGCTTKHSYKITGGIFSSQPNLQ